MPALPPNPAGPFRTLTLERRDDGVVVMSFFVPDHAQNVLTAEAVKDLSQALDSIEAGPPPAAIVIRSSREGSFFAGADVARLERLHDMPPEEIERLCVAGRGVFSRLSSQACPSVAIIDGICLGGGLELALACDLRVATDSPHTTIGCPEVKLGLLPGWGGTVLLARLMARPLRSNWRRRVKTSTAPPLPDWVWSMPACQRTRRSSRPADSRKS
jgi:3-hydroxyacyl-CoA dehydrogenase/enoyl-CoA hydratase/3-hydroxybutyryl-CoA epimerase